MARPSPHVRIPNYCFHKARGTAYVRIDCHVHYLPGKYGSPESRQEYDRLVGLWQLNGRRLPAEALPVAGHAAASAVTVLVASASSPTPMAAAPAPATGTMAATAPSSLLVHLGPQNPVAAPSHTTVTELIDAFLIDCEREYPPREGKRNTELANIESAMSSLNKLYGPMPAGQIKPVYLETVMQDYVARGFCRKMVNRNLSYLKRVFKWGVKRDLVTGETYYKLTTVSGLRKGRCNAKDNPAVRPVSEALVEATLPYLSEELAAIARLQLLTGMRSDEVARMRERDLERTGPVWRYALEKHKTAHHGISRQVPIGPKAQAIIKPFLTDDPEAYLFSPARAEAKRRAAMHEQRKTPLSCGNVPGSNRKAKPQRTPGERYDSNAYGKAVRRACRKAFRVPDELRPDTSMWKTKFRYIEEHGQEAFEAHHAKVMAWYEQHFWHPHQLRHTASTRVARTFGEIASQNLLGHTTLKTTAIYTERNWKQAEEVMAVMG